MTYSANCSERVESIKKLIDLWVDFENESLDTQSLIKIIGRDVAVCLDAILSEIYMKIHESNFPTAIDRARCVGKLIAAVNDCGMEYITSLDGERK